MSDNQEKAVDSSRRNLLIATSVAGGVGGVATLVPFVSSLQPSERAKAGGAPVEADISGLQPGQMMTVSWRGLPVWIVNRTPEQMASLSKVTAELADPDSKQTFSFPMPDYCKNAFRARESRKEMLVVVGICTHLGCIPSGRSGPTPMLRWAMTPVSFVRATARPTTCRVACSRTSRRQRISTFLVSCS